MSRRSPIRLVLHAPQDQRQRLLLFSNLPIGTYTITFVHEGFDTQKFPSILVQADRTATVNAELKIGQVSTSVTVEATPLMNAVDTTNGYVLDKQQIDTIPLPTGSFTGLAILSPGVNAELPGGTGSNSGLGNAPIWANGQRDTSNAFLLNGVDASNLFNGKSTSQVASARVVNNTGGSASAAPPAPASSRARRRSISPSGMRSPRRRRRRCRRSASTLRCTTRSRARPAARIST